ncbi:hypothetical protein KFL_000630230 [Klebsormidium nitens]|uniref:TPM domain-containing protein n=1 Tax=Klebsormidium nitens TaxID=105231 RepID=A0A1Y1HQC1_KLENI|nr:hypothetical protein KFL_000630230 [Klebsormidium nitens]|eukprot:GAQ80820.1 hypothetical protein KFL_000630230 [Klebsormidium nitens]
MRSSKSEPLRQPFDEQLALVAAAGNARSYSTKDVDRVAAELALLQTQSSACLAATRAAFDAPLQPLLRTLVCTALVFLTSASGMAFVSPAAAGAAPVTVLSGPLRPPSHSLGVRSAQSAVPLWPLAFVEYASVFDVPNPRTSHGGWVVDDASVMSDSQKGHIEHVAQKVKDETGAEIALVTVDQLSRKTTAKAFATELFNTWRIGDRERNNGVLVLLVKEQRRLEIEIGRGVKGPFNRASWLKGMQKQTMVPLLKKDDFGGGLVAGVDALADNLRAVEAKPAANEKLTDEKPSPGRAGRFPLMIGTGERAASGGFCAGLRAHGEVRDGTAEHQKAPEQPNISEDGSVWVGLLYLGPLAGFSAYQYNQDRLERKRLEEEIASKQREELIARVRREEQIARKRFEELIANERREELNARIKAISRASTKIESSGGTSSRGQSGSGTSGGNVGATNRRESGSITKTGSSAGATSRKGSRESTKSGSASYTRPTSYDDDYYVSGSYWSGSSSSSSSSSSSTGSSYGSSSDSSYSSSSDSSYGSSDFGGGSSDGDGCGSDF